VAHGWREKPAIYMQTITHFQIVYENSYNQTGYSWSRILLEKFVLAQLVKTFMVACDKGNVSKH
jgi:hypothetical protein